MPAVTWNLATGESLANFVTSNTINGFSGFGFTLNGTGSRLLGFLNTNGTMTQPSNHTDSVATSFTFQNNSLAVVSVSGTTIDVDVFYQNHLVPNGIQDAIDYLFGTLGTGGNAYQGTTGGQVFEAFRDGDGFIGRGGDDVFQLGRVTAVTDISYIHGDESDGTSLGGFDTIRLVGAFNGTIHEISNIDAIVFDAAAAVTFALNDTNTSVHNPLGFVLITTNVIGASLTLTQAADGPTRWSTAGWTFAGSQPFALTVNTHEGDYADTVFVEGPSQAAHLGTVHINTYGGNDVISALGAHVVIDGGDGIDQLAASARSAGAGISFDLLDGSPNWAAFGYESVTGIERVSMSGGDFDDTLSGGHYTDLIMGFGGSDSISGENGDDNLAGGEGNDTIRGGNDKDYIDGGVDNDKLYGDDGEDQINGSQGDDWIEGGNDNDYVGGGRGSDTMDGGSGIDMLSFAFDETYVDGSHGVIASLSGAIDTDGAVYPADLDADAVAALLAIAGTASFTLAAGTALGADGSIDHYSNFEGLSGSQLGDFLIGDDDANTLYGDMGDDWIFGEAGADTIYGGSGADRLFGGAGGDLLSGDSEDDTITGGAGDDTIDGGDGTGDTAVYAGAWTAFSFSGTGTITVDGTAVGEGTDQVSNVEFFTFNGKTGTADKLANVGPVGVDDSASVVEPSGPSPVTPPATGNVLANDTDANSVFGDTKTLTGVRAGPESGSGSLTAVSASTIVQGTYGALTVNTDGSYSYALDGTLAATLALKGGAVAHDVFTYQIEDAHGATDLAQIDVTVRETNDAPAGTSKTITVNEDTSRSFAASDFGFSDSDGNAFSKVIISALPGKGTLKLSGVAVTPNQAIAVSQLSHLVWTPAANGNGTTYATIGFKVMDNGGTANGGVDTDGSANTLTFKVMAVNDAPVITAPNGGATTSIQVNENIKTTTAVTTVHASDVDGPSITYSIVSGGDSSRFSINSSTGALTFKAVPDFEKPADADHNNVYKIQVKASDGALQDTQSLTITVRNVAGSVTGTSAGEKIDATHGVGGKFATGEEDKIDGKAGNDTINGLSGNDTLTGGSGKDHFVFSTALSVAGIDTITDFTRGQDTIDLKASIFGGLVSGGIVDAEIKIVTSGHSASAGDHLIYNKANGTLWYDANGVAGGEVEIAILSNKPALLNHSDFTLI